MIIGYARKSTEEQRFDLQIEALRSAGCEKIFSDTGSGTSDDRKGLKDALDELKPGDLLVVWKLDRLGRSLPHLISTLEDLGNRKIGFKSLNEALDSTTPGGKLIFHIFAALAEFEVGILRMRTNAGLQAAKLKGRVGGRPQKMDLKKTATARRLLADPAISIEDVCTGLQVSKSTLYRNLVPRLTFGEPYHNGTSYEPSPS